MKLIHLGVSSLYVTIGAALGVFILIIVVIIIVRCCCCARMDEKSKIPPNPFKGEDPFCPPNGVHDDDMEKPYIYPPMCTITPYATVIPRGAAKNPLSRPPQASRLAKRLGLISNLKALGIVYKPQKRQGEEQEEEDEDCTPHQTIRGLSELHLDVQTASRDETVTDDSEGSIGAGWASGPFASRNSVTTRDFEESDEWLSNPRPRAP